MTTIKTFISTVALLAAATGFAQTNSTCSWFPKGDEYGQGVIGKRYVEAGFSVEDVRHTAHSVCDAGINANVPVVQGFELNGGYNYSWYTTPAYSYYGNRLSDDRTHAHSIDGNATLYTTIENGIKPFVSAGLQQSWQDTNGPYNFHQAYNRTAWGLSVGAEFPYKWVAVIPTISYQDDFKRSLESSQAFAYGVEVNSWITRKIGGFLSATYVDRQHTTQHDWTYGVGVRVLF